MCGSVLLDKPGKQKATSSLTSPGLLLPSASASTSGRMEDGFGEYLRRQLGQDQNISASSSSQAPLLPFFQSQSPSQPSSQSTRQVSEALSDPSLFLPQDTVMTATTQELRWGGKPEFGDTRTAADPSEGGQIQIQSQGPSQMQGQQQPEMSRQEAFSQMIEYHREGLDRSIGGRRDGDDDRGRDDDERGRKQRSDGELCFEVEPGDNTIGKEMAATSSSAPSAFSSSSRSAGPSVSTMTNNNNNNNNNNNAFSLFPFKGDKDDTSSSLSNVNGEGLQVYTVGHLMPRNTFADDGSWNFDTNGCSHAGIASTAAAAAKDVGNFVSGPATVTTAQGDDGGDENEDEDVEMVPPRMFIGPSTSTSASTSTSSSHQQKLRVRRATFVPSRWAVSPRVLLVDDDAVTRRLSSQFLKIFGCTTDVAVDGIGAVTKMNLEKYDLVLMVNLFFIFFLATHVLEMNYFFLVCLGHLDA